MSESKEQTVNEKAQETNKLVLLEFVALIGDLPLETPPTVASALLSDELISRDDKGKVHVTEKGSSFILGARSSLGHSRVIRNSAVLNTFLKSLAGKPEEVKAVVQELFSMMPVVPLTNAQSAELATELEKHDNAFRIWVQYMQNLQRIQRAASNKRKVELEVGGVGDADGISIGGLDTRVEVESQNPVPGPRGGEDKIELDDESVS